MSAAVVLLGAAMGVVEWGRLLLRLRRARRLNRALHELRRPLQTMAFAIEDREPDVRCAEACLAQVRSALAGLDAAVNGRAVAARPVRVAIGELTASLEDRWRGAGVRVAATEPGRSLEADPGRLGAALDNLVANAVEHGAGPVSVRALSSAHSVRFEVRDGGGSLGAGRPGSSGPRRGHGLRVAGEAAAAHGGTVLPPRPEGHGGTLAVISLPAPARDRRGAA